MDRSKIADRSAINLDAEWEPVTLFIDGVMEIVCAPFDALFWLDNHWPADLSAPEQARLDCYCALIKGQGVGEARCRFIEACNAAGWDIVP